VTSGAADAANSVLALVPADRRSTLIATRGNVVCSLDVHLQGHTETAFFEV
jgi:protocatechuate 3,4-dioxygenase alpha subunit